MKRRQARRDNPDQSREQQERDVREAILEATRLLLAQQRFDELSVADILSAAQISRASFYFYFDSKHAVLGELVQRAIGQAQNIAQPWIQEDEEPPEKTLREGTGLAVQFWINNAPVLQAIVENWRFDDRLTEIWTAMMESFTQAAAYRIERDRERGYAPLTGTDASELASVLTWMSERAYYLTAIKHPAFSNEQQAADIIAHIWLSAIYNSPSTDKASNKEDRS